MSTGDLKTDRWGHGPDYDAYVGRLSRRIAPLLLEWIDAKPNGRWLDVGCATGPLAATALEIAEPREVVGVDPAEGFVTHARETIRDPRARFEIGDAAALAFADESFDVVVSGLVFNFVPDAARAAAEMARVAAPGGIVAGYVWDYTADMQVIRSFWDAAVALDPAAVERDEGTRFRKIARPEALAALFQDAGLADVATRALEVLAVFRDFDDYWLPFLTGQAPAPEYCVALDEHARVRLRESLRRRLPIESDGSIRLRARAWGVRGVRR